MKKFGTLLTFAALATSFAGVSAYAQSSSSSSSGSSRSSGSYSLDAGDDAYPLDTDDSSGTGQNADSSASGAGTSSHKMKLDDVIDPRDNRRLTGSLKLNAEEGIVQGNVPTTGIGAGINWNFTGSYAVGTEFSYKKPYNTFENYAFNGADDLSLYFADRELYANRAHDFRMDYRLAAAFPTSQRSQTASMIWGSIEEIGAKKGLTKHLSLTYRLMLSQYYFDYDTSSTPSPNPKYNVPYSVRNSLSLSYDITKNFRWENGANIRSSTNYNDFTSSTYGVSTGVAYQATKDYSVDFGIRTSAKDTGTNPQASTDPASNGAAPAVERSGDELFEPEGTAVYLGMTIKI